MPFGQRKRLLERARSRAKKTKSCGSTAGTQPSGTTTSTQDVHVGMQVMINATLTMLN